MTERYRVIATAITLGFMLVGMAFTAQPALSYQGEEPTATDGLAVTDISFTLQESDPSLVKSVTFRLLAPGWSADPEAVRVTFGGYEDASGRCERCGPSWTCEFSQGLPLAYLEQMQVTH